MKKKVIAEGLNGLLTPAPEKQTNAATATETPKTYRGITRPVTYNLDALMLEKVRYVAFVSHKKNNAVVTEALEAYLAEWEKTNGEINVTL